MYTQYKPTPFSFFLLNEIKSLQVCSKNINLLVHLAVCKYMYS